jgi:hypothetical protein
VRSLHRILSILTACLVLLLLPMPLLAEDSPANLTASEISDLFSQGKEFFRQANETSATDATDATDATAARELYQKAALRFERIANEGGVDNGKLYYNIGNAYFRMKDIGRAILSYRRAELYAPNDANLQQNLAYALQRRQDEVEVQAQRKIMHTLFFWHYDISARSRAWMFGGAFASAWVFATLLLFTRRPWMKWVAGISAVVAVAPPTPEAASSSPNPLSPAKVTAPATNPAFRIPFTPAPSSDFWKIAEPGSISRLPMAASAGCHVKTWNWCGRTAAGCHPAQSRVLAASGRRCFDSELTYRP